MTDKMIEMAERLIERLQRMKHRAMPQRDWDHLNEEIEFLERLSSSEVTEEEVERVALVIQPLLDQTDDGRTIARAAITAMRSAATSEPKEQHP